jgi:trigger factor
VAKREALSVDQNELTQHMLRRAQQSGQNPQEYVQHMMEHNHIPELVSEVVRGKALARVVEQARVTDASGNPVELKNLRPDGTIGEPVDETVEATDDAESTEAPAEAGPETPAEG